MTRKILVTGASSGIGRAVCESRLRRGDAVVAVARDFRSFPCSNSGFHAVVIDLADLPGLPGRLRDLAAAQGDIDALVCNAGEAQFGHLEQFSYQQISHALDLNFTSQAFVARAFVPLFKERGRGDIVFMGSEASLRGGRRGSLYCAAKFALRGFAQALREETAASGLRVTLVNPGMVKTGFHDELDFRPGADPDQHLLPSDVAAAIDAVLDSRAEAVFDEITLTPQKRVVDFGGASERRSSGD